MLSKVSVDDVFIHSFHNVSTASESFGIRPSTGPRLWTPLWDFRSSDPLTCPPLKEVLRAPMPPEEEYGFIVFNFVYIFQ